MPVKTDINLPATADDIGHAFVRLKLFNNDNLPAISARSLTLARTMYSTVSDDYHCKMGFLSNSASYYKRHGYYKGYTKPHDRIELFNANKEDFFDIMDNIVVTKRKGSRIKYISKLLERPVDDKGVIAINDTLEGKEKPMGANESALYDEFKVALVDATIGYALIDKLHKRLSKGWDAIAEVRSNIESSYNNLGGGGLFKSGVVISVPIIENMEKITDSAKADKELKTITPNIKSIENQIRINSLEQTVIPQLQALKKSSSSDDQLNRVDKTIKRA